MGLHNSAPRLTNSTAPGPYDGDLSAGSYSLTATDPTTSTASNPFDVTVISAPAISTGAGNSDKSVTLTGTAPAGATVTVYELTTSTGVTTALGTATATGTGAWSFTTAALAGGVYDFTATERLRRGPARRPTARCGSFCKSRHVLCEL